MNPYQVDLASAFDAPMQSLQQLMGQEQIMRAREAELAQMPARGRLLEAQAKSAERGLQRQDDLQALFAGGMPEGKSASESLTELATRVAPIDPTLAGQMFSRAGTAAVAEERAAASKASADRARTTALANMQRVLERTMGKLETPEAFGEWQLGMLASPEMMANPYAEEFVRNMTWERYQQLRSTIDLQVKETNAQTAATNAVTAARNARTAELRAQAAAAADASRDGRGARIAKDTGPRPVKAPTAAQVRGADSFLRDNPEVAGIEGNQRRALAYDVASRAAAIMNRNPAVDAGAAQAMALGELINEGVVGEEETLMGTRRVYQPMSPAAAARRRLPSGAPTETIRPGEPVATDAQGNKMVVRNGKWVPAK